MSICACLHVYVYVISLSVPVSGSVSVPLSVSMCACPRLFWRPCGVLWRPVNAEKCEQVRADVCTSAPGYLEALKSPFLHQNKNKGRKGKLFFLDENHVFRGRENGEWRKTFGEEKFAGRASEDEEERYSGSRWKKADFFSSLTNRIKKLLQNKIHRPTKIQWAGHIFYLLRQPDLRWSWSLCWSWWPIFVSLVQITTNKNYYFPESLI